MENGFLYRIIKFLLDNFRHLTLVEWLKEIGLKIWCKKTDDIQKRINCRSNIVDGFNVFKWAFLILLFFTHWTNCFLAIFVWYLLITNLYSYFYHHIWSDNAIKLEITSPDRARRRFFLLMLSFGYSVICFAYLYRFTYVNEFNWSGAATNTKSIWFSISSSFAGNYDIVKPMSELGSSISMIQLIITFVFVTIIISRTIPEIKK